MNSFGFGVSLCSSVFGFSFVEPRNESGQTLHLTTNGHLHDQLLHSCIQLSLERNAWRTYCSHQLHTVVGHAPIFTLADFDTVNKTHKQNNDISS